MARHRPCARTAEARRTGCARGSRQELRASNGARLAAFSENDATTALVHRLVKRLLMTVGVGLMAYVAVRLVMDFDTAKTGRSLALPVWLTLGVLPLIYCVGLWTAYEQAFIRIDLQTDDPAGRRRAKLALLRTAHVRAR